MNYLKQQTVQETIKLLARKPEIDGRIKHYKEVGETHDKATLATTKTIETGYTVSKRLGITTKHYFSDYDMARMKGDLLSIRERIYTNNTYLKEWLTLSDQYDKVFSEQCIEMEEHFDAMVQKCVFLATKHEFLNRLMTEYNKIAENDKNQEMRLEYYLRLKAILQEAEKGNKK